MDSAKTALSVMGAYAFGLTFVPLPLRAKLDACIRDLWEKLFTTADPFAYVEVPGKSKGIITSISSGQNPNVYHQATSTGNPFYAEVGLYLGSLNIEFATRRVSVYGMHLPDAHDGSLSGASKFIFGLPLNETLTDTFEGAQFSWTHTVASHGNHSSSHGQNDDDADNVFTLTVLKSDKHRLLHRYLNHISTVAHAIRQKNTLRTLYSNNRHGSHWAPITLKHPSTFDTIALDGDLAERIQVDLKAFLESEAYYHSIGRAWKRGYLLYGPPGTGKSSLIAAIANYMHYDIYDLELTNVFHNTDLQTLLMQTTRKSIIVIEDIDCSTHKGISKRQEFNEVYEEAPQSRSQGFTLSGLLNFADGLLSCFGEERIFIFTTNHKERLDSALLRSGRMDMHIHLSYCSFSMLKKLVVNYMGIKNHELYGELEEAMKLGVKITPASIAEILISERKNPDEAMKQVFAAVKGGDTVDKGQVMIAAADGAVALANTGRRRKFACGNYGGSHSGGPARKKRQATVDVYTSTAKDTGLWSSDEEFEGPDGDSPAATTVGEQVEDGSNGLCQGLQGDSDDCLKELAGDKPLETVATNAPKPVDSGEEQFFHAGFEQLGGEAVQTGSNINASDSLGLWQDMMIDDSEGSTDEGSRKPVAASTIATDPSLFLGKLCEDSKGTLDESVKRTTQKVAKLQRSHGNCNKSK